MAVTTGRYSPMIKRSVEPEIPGSTIAQMAIIPAKNTNRASPGVRCSRLTPSPPLLGLK